MSLTYEQFKAVLPDEQARASFGLTLTDQEARWLLENEDGALNWYTQWTTGGQAQQTPQSAARFDGASIAGFVCSIVAALIVTAPAIVTFAMILAVFGALLSFLGFQRTRAMRGRGFAIAGFILGLLALLAGIGMYVSNGVLF